jgi:hypothetical protein
MANKEGHKPQALKYHSSVLGTNEYGHHNNDDDVHACTGVHTRSTPKYVPTPTHFPPTPAPISLERDSLHSNKRGHMTMLKSCESMPNTTYNDDNRRRVNRADPHTDERLELEELEHMYMEWGYKAPKPAALHSTHSGTSDSTNLYAPLLHYPRIHPTQPHPPPTPTLKLFAVTSTTAS